MLNALKSFALDYDYSAPDATTNTTNTTTITSDAYDLPMYANDTKVNDVLSGGMMVGFMALWVALLVFMIITMWKVFTKANQAGWKSLIPIYNSYILLKIVGRPWWWLLLMLVPGVNVVVMVIVYLNLAKAFGKGTGFGIGLFLLGPIFMAILAFGKSSYKAPATR